MSYSRSFRSKPVGWRGESYRHYLAAKGVKTHFAFKEMKGFRSVEVPIEEARVKRGVYGLSNRLFVSRDDFRKFDMKDPFAVESEDFERMRSELDLAESAERKRLEEKYGDRWIHMWMKKRQAYEVDDDEDWWVRRNAEYGVKPPMTEEEAKKVAWTALIERRKKEWLKDRGLSEDLVVFKPVRIPVDSSGVSVSVRYKPKAFAEAIDIVMKPRHESAALFSASDDPRRVEEYVRNLEGALLSEEELVPPPPMSLRKGKARMELLGEGRHRIVAAENIGLKKIPFRVVDE